MSVDFKVFTNDQIMNLQAFAADLKMRKLGGFQIFKVETVRVQI